MSIREFKGKIPKIHDTVYVDESAVIIGDVVIGEDSSVWPMAVIRGDVQAIRIGKKTNIQDGCIIHVTHDSKYTPGGYPTAVGDCVTIGHRVTLHACTVGNYCLLGMSATVMDGAVIPDRIIIGAGSLVPTGKQLETNSLYIGSPVKRVRTLKDSEFELLHYSAEHYAKHKNNYLKS